MWLDAALAYLHFAAIFALFAFMSVQVVLLKQPLDERFVRLLGRMDVWYAGSAALVLLSGFLRAGLGAKGGDFYFSTWPIYVKIGMFLVVGMISIYPTLAFIRWRRAYDHDPGWRLPAEEHARIRKLKMAEVHLAALIPVVAVIMSRGLGH
jgi:putative membrane protein